MRTARYYQVRHVVRLAFWSTAVAAGFALLLIAAGMLSKALFGVDLSDAS